MVVWSNPYFQKGTDVVDFEGIKKLSKDVVHSRGMSFLGRLLLSWGSGCYKTIRNAICRDVLTPQGTSYYTICKVFSSVCLVEIAAVFIWKTILRFAEYVWKKVLYLQWMTKPLWRECQLSVHLLFAASTEEHYVYNKIT